MEARGGLLRRPAAAGPAASRVEGLNKNIYTYYMYIHTYIHTYILCIYIYTYIYLFIYLFMYIYIYVSICGFGIHLGLNGLEIHLGLRVWGSFGEQALGFSWG